MARWMDVQKHMALFVHPVAATGDFLLGGVADSGPSIAVFMARPYMWLSLLFTLLITMLLTHRLGPWMRAIGS